MLQEKFAEWIKSLWIATIDYRKAFYMVEHKAIWKALQEQNIHTSYINTLQRLYDGQTGLIMARDESRFFEILRGTNQGDPINPPLFNAVLEHAMANLRKKWTKRAWCVKIASGRDDFLTNVRLPDDIFLAATSLRTLQRNMDIEVMEPTASAMYLGRELSLTTPRDTELRHRMRKCWATFSIFKSEFTDKGVPLHLWLKLFNTVLTPTVMYSCSSWSMTKAREDALRSIQTKMLRTVLGRRRIANEITGVVETWVEWV